VRDWPPLAALRQWLRDELELSRKALHPPAQKRKRVARTSQ
jgi:LysR family glycine cleavage system transcriptional activator